MTAPPQPPLSIDSRIPRVILFGRPGVGKTALLAALFQAGEQQGQTLLGEVQESSGRLAALRDATYRGTSLEPTPAELTSYLVRLRPWRDSGRLVGAAASIVLHDCSGLASSGLIGRPTAVFDPEPRSPLARAVVEADAVLLLVNASVEDEEVAEAFAEFEAFLAAVGRGKAAAREVGGFPVYLVLTQCDKLALSGDTRSKWESRVEDCAERAWARFSEFLKSANHEEDGPTPFLPFGSLALLVYAVAIRRPRLDDAPGQPALPYNVAELFRDCFAAAKAHRARVRGSSVRLRWTLRGACAVLALLVLAAIGVAVFRPGTDTELADEVIAYQMREPSEGTRLEDVHRLRDKQLLTHFKDDPGFNTLPADLQDFVTGRLKEIEVYDHYLARLHATTTPAECRSLDELALVEHTLRADLGSPDGYDWSDSPAAALRDKWLADVKAIRKAEGEFVDKYHKLILRGTNLITTNSFGGSWRANVQELLTQPLRLPVAAAAILPPTLREDLWRDMDFDPILELNAPLPESPEVPARGGAPVNYRVPYEFERVYQARTEWQSTKHRLAHLRDLADALGLTAGGNRPEPLLVLPESSPGANAATLPTTRWTTLVRKYPEATDDFKEWTLRNFPEPGRKVLEEAMERSFRTGVRYVQGLILMRLQVDGKPIDSPENWRALAGVLTDSTTPFPEWGKLLHLYARLRDTEAPNPVVDLANFLRQSTFTLDLREATLRIPLDLTLDKVYPAGPLSLTAGKARTVRLKAGGEGVREGSNTIYHLTAEGDSKLSYSPGDRLRAEMPVRSGAQDLKLVWEKANSRTYPFDLFLHEPRLMKSDGSSEPATGVKLTPAAGDAWPRLPALLPEVPK